MFYVHSLIASISLIIYFLFSSVMAKFNVTLNQSLLILFASPHMSHAVKLITFTFVITLSLKTMISSSLKEAYEKWFFFQLWVNKLAMKVTFIELRNENLTVSRHQMAAHFLAKFNNSANLIYILIHIIYG